MFYPSGYMVEIGETRQQANNTLRYLFDSLWLDNSSDTISIQFIVYTANVNLMSIVQAKFQLKEPVGVRVDKYVYTMKMYRSTHNFHIFVLILEVIYVVYTAYFLLHVARKVHRQRSKYFHSLWNVLDILTIIMSLVVIITYICHVVIADAAIEQYKSQHDTTNFFQVVIMDSVITYSLGLLVTCGMLKFVHMLRFNPIIYCFLTVFSRARVLLGCMTFLILMVFMMFGSLMYQIACSKLYMFRSMPSTLQNLYLGMLGDFDIDQLVELHPIWGPLCMMMFLLTTTYVAFNLFLSILLATMSVVASEDLPNEEAELLTRLMDKGLQWMGIKNKPNMVIQVNN